RFLKFRQDLGLNQRFLNFPVYQFLRHPLGQPSGGIPFAVLVNGSGEMVGSGSPGRLYSMIPMLTEQAARVQAYTSSPLEHPLSGLSAETFLKHAEAFVPGKVWQGSLKKLRNAAKKNSDLEIVVSTVEAYLQEEPGRLEELAKERPAAAYVRLGILLKSLKGMPEAEGVQAQYDKLAEDQNVRDLAQIQTNLEKFRARSQKLKPSVQKSKRKGFVKTLETYVQREDLDALLSAEAQGMVDALRL
ncbi:MAG: hypothetical protein Q4D98_07475, partial [Planctomycetia bacterium]|nr:hypothetical protein [Planctomycetia bacterium]